MSQASAGKGARAPHPFQVIDGSLCSAGFGGHGRGATRSPNTCCMVCKTDNSECNAPPHILGETPSLLVLNPAWRRRHSARLTWTCCFCAFSMFGSMERGPSTLIISSFSISQGRSWASAAWKLASWFADSSSFCCRSAVAWLALSHLQSEAPGCVGGGRAPGQPTPPSRRSLTLLPVVSPPGNLLSFSMKLAWLY